MNQPTNGQPDRISYSYGFKSADAGNVHMSYSTDVQTDETPYQAMERARLFVMKQCSQSRSEPRQAAPRYDARKREVFDVNNPFHREQAAAVFDRNFVKSESRRRLLAEQFLAGQPLDQIGPIIAAETENFKKSGGRPFLVGRNDGSKGNWDGRFNG